MSFRAVFGYTIFEVDTRYALSGYEISPREERIACGTKGREVLQRRILSMKEERERSKWTLSVVVRRGAFLEESIAFFVG